MLCLALASVSAVAQETPIQFTLLDSSAQCVEGVHCVIYSLPDSIPVVSSWSNAKGLVECSLPSNASYRMKLAYMGTLLKEHTFRTPQGTDTLHVGTFYIDNRSIQMDQVVIKRQHIVHKPSRTTLNLKGSSMEHIGSLLDVLRETPRVVVQNDEVSILGKGAPVIFLNGRKIESIREIMHLKSSDIQSIDVLTNPSGRYGVNASSALLIKTTRHSQEIFGFDLYDHTNFALYRRPIKNAVNNLFDGMVFFNTDKVKVITSINHYYGGSQWYMENFYRYKVAQDSILNHDMATKCRYNMTWGLVSDVTYYINDHHSINFYVSGTPHDIYKTIQNGRFSHRVNDTTQESYAQNNNTDTKNYNYLVSGGYIYDTKRSNVSLFTSYFGNEDRVKRGIMYNAPDEVERLFEAKHSSQLFSTKCDWDQEIIESLSTQVGVDYNLTLRKDRYGTENQTHDFFQQHRLAGYFGSRYNWGEHWEFSAEIGVEYVDFRYFVNDILSKEQSRYSVEWLPRASVAYTWQKFAVQLAYSKYVKRPTYNQLSENYFMSNEYLRWDGNSSLLSGYGHNLDLSMVYAWATLGVGAARVYNSFFEVNTRTSDTSKIIITQPRNLPTHNRLTVGLSCSPKWGDFSLVGDVAAQWQDLQYNGVSYKKPLIQYSVRVGYDFPYQISMRCGVHGHGKNGNYLTGLTQGYLDLNFRLSKRWLEGSLITQLYIRDILNTSYENVFLDTNGILYNDFSYGGTRTLRLVVQYHWGRRSRKTGGAFLQEQARLGL